MTSTHPPVWWKAPLGPLTNGRDLCGDLHEGICRAAHCGAVRQDVRAAVAGALALLLVPLAPYDDTPTAQHRTVDARNYARRITFSHFDESMTLTKIDLADTSRGNPAFARDHPHQIAGLHTVASAYRHEEPSHATARGVGTLYVGRPRARHGQLARLCGTPLRSLTIQQLERGGGDFGGVELLEHRLQRNQLPRWNSARQYRAQLLTNRLLAVVRPPLRTLKIHRSEPSTRQLSKGRNLAWLSEHHYLDRLRLRDPLQLSRRCWRLKEDDGVRGFLEVAAGDADGPIIFVVAQCPYSVCRVSSGRFVARDDYR